MNLDSRTPQLEAPLLHPVVSGLDPDSDGVAPRW